MGMTRLFPLLIFLSLSSSCHSNAQLSQAKPLLPGDKLISEDGTFALGFFSPTNSSNSLYIGIWYHGIPEQTIVWVANRDSPITTPSSAKLTITNDTKLVLQDSQGRAVWMTTNTAAVATGGAGAVAVLLNSGNFVLRASNGTKVWQSFDHPTDTVLPTMRFLVSSEEQVLGRLVAWKGRDDPSTGDLSLSMHPNGYLQIFIWNGTRPYCRFAVFSDVATTGAVFISNTTSITSQLIGSSGDLLYYTYMVSSGPPYFRISLHHTGKLRMLSWNNNTASWEVIIERPFADCDLYDSCGPFGYCDYIGDVAACRCLDGFEPDVVGCRRKEILKCRNEDRFVTVPRMKVPDKFLHIRNRSFDQCVAECSRNCSCTAYAYATAYEYANMSRDGDMADLSRCLVWNGDLVDMWRASNFGENLYLRIAGAESPVKDKSSLQKILPPVIVCPLLLASTALVCTCRYRGKQKKKEEQKKRMLEYLRSTDEAEDKNIGFPFINFEDIVTATNNFSDSNMLGEGGFGKVYKGILDGNEEVAIKRLSKGSGQGTQEFRNEVVLIAKLQHKNLVKLLSCCIHEEERLLVYEYLPNKSLDYFLFDSTRKPMLQWSTRYKIIQGIARGILYLHQDSRLTIIHRDLKASNILLDKEMGPKISDFGMARIFHSDQQQANTNRVVGTYGYMSPEYAMEGIFSVKSDTYSFGVLVLEIVSGLKISSPNHITDFSNLIVYAWNFWKDGKAEEMVDSSIKENCTLDEVSRCIHIGLLCVQDSPHFRPLMSAVVSMLENETTPLPTPKQPVYFVQRGSELGEVADNKETSEKHLSITELEGR